MLITVIASIGFVFSVTTFISGVRMIRLTDKRAESMMHRFNGFIVGAIYLLLALISLTGQLTPIALLIWMAGFSIHLLKLFLVRKKLAVRYGGFVGSFILITWIIIIFNHLPD